jgi:hypothetical protein
MDTPRRIDLDAERTVGQILRATLGLYREYPLLFAILALAVIAPYELARLAATGLGPLAEGGSVKHGDSGAYWLFQLLSMFFVSPLISALHVHAVVEVGEGRRPRLVAVARRGFAVLPVVAAAEIVATVLTVLGLIALIIPGLLLTLRLSVVAQTAAIEHEGWLPSLRRSWRLTADAYGRIFGLLATGAAISFAIDLAAGQSVSGKGTTPAAVALGIGVHTLTASFFALLLALLYFALRAREAAPARRSVREYHELRDLD